MFRIFREKAASLVDIKYGRFILTKHSSFLKNLKMIIQEFMTSCEDTDLFGVCAQMAFTLLFALLPTLLFIILICSQFVPDFDSLFYSLIQILLPSAGFEYISNEIDQLVLYLNKIGFLIIILSALMGTLSSHTFLSGINQTYGFENYSSKKWEWFKSFIILLVFIIILSLLTALFIYVCRLAEIALTENIPFVNILDFDEAFFDILLILGIFIVLTGFYQFTPQKHIRLKEALPGAFFSTAGILIVFRIYVYILNRSTNYLLVYGSLSGLFLLLTAFYFVCIILNLGAKINVFFSFLNIERSYDKITK